VGPYRALMDFLDALIAVGAAGNIAGGIVMLLRSRGRSAASIRWRQGIVAPRLAASTFLFMGLSFAFVTVAHVFLPPGSLGYGFLLLAALVSIGVSIFVGLKWIRRRDLSAREGR
jgi:hypothetical protein